AWLFSDTPDNRRLGTVGTNPGGAYNFTGAGDHKLHPGPHAFDLPRIYRHRHHQVIPPEIVAVPSPGQTDLQNLNVDRFLDESFKARRQQGQIHLFSNSGRGTCKFSQSCRRLTIKLFKESNYLHVVARPVVKLAEPCNIITEIDNLILGNQVL